MRKLLFAVLSLLAIIAFSQVIGGSGMIGTAPASAGPQGGSTGG